jgi:glycosyltransferase involved in cell wall biosynthesis
MPLTVVQVLPALEVGGVERGTLEIADGLVRSGHRSIVISQGGRLVEKLLSQGSEHIEWSIGKKSLFTLRHIKQLKNLLRNTPVDILHARSRLPAWICYLAWKSMHENDRPKFITTVHGPYSVNAYSKIMTKGEKIIAVSKFINDYISTNYNDVPQEKISVIHRGIDTDEFPYGFHPNNDWQEKWEKKHCALKNKFILTLPARITRWKGQEDFLRIVYELKKIAIPVHGLIAGAPHPRRINFFKQLNEQAKALGLENDVDFIGQRDDMKEVMSISNIVLSLAKEPEAFGRTALEALSLGIPVVAYDHGGASEVLNAMFPNGLIYPNDVESAIEKIKTLYETKPVISENIPFTKQSMVNKTIALYEKLQNN